MRISLLAAILLLAACDPMPAAPPAPPSFAQLPPLVLDVSAISLTEEYLPSTRPPHVETMFALPLSEGIKIWVRDRLKAAGGERTAEVIIREASVTESQLPLDSGVTGWLKKEQDKRYDGKLSVEIRIYGPTRSVSEASVDATVIRSRTLVEGASAAERERLWSSMTSEMLGAMNAELEKNIRQYFGGYMTGAAR